MLNEAERERARERNGMGDREGGQVKTLHKKIDFYFVAICV